MFLLAAYGKNEEANLSKAERNAIARLVPALIRNYSEESGKKVKVKNSNSKVGLKKAPAWALGSSKVSKKQSPGRRAKNVAVRVTQIQVPDINVSEVRHRMGLNQSQFAAKFGFPPATLRKWEQGRARPDAPTTISFH